MRLCWVLAVLLVISSLAKGQRAPDQFNVKFTTTVTSQPNNFIVLNITRSNAPLGVDRFYQLLTLSEGSYYNQVQKYNLYEKNTYILIAA